MALATALGLAFGCSTSSPTSPGTAAVRTYRMGFSPIPPRPDFAAAVAAIQMWVPRSDAAILHYEAPWDSLLAGVPPDSIVTRELVPVAQYFRASGLSLVVLVDPTNGLDRSSDAAPLVAAGRSLTEPAIQQLLRAYVVTVDTLLGPDYLGLAAETNLIRAIAPPALYDAVRQVANDAAADVRAVDASVRLFVSVQVEVAWGRLVPPFTFVGIGQDRADFPFLQALGLSSYPYLGGWAQPADLPLDYYARLVAASPVPTLVVEGGWTSEPVVGIPSSPATQSEYLRKQATLLDEAGSIGVFQLTFTDIDTMSFPVPPGTSVTPFAFLGLVDVNLSPKPSLAEWDRIFGRRLASTAP